MKIKTISLREREVDKIKKIYYSTVTIKFGKFLIASTDHGVCSILLFKKFPAALKEIHAHWPKAMLVQKEMPTHTLVKKLMVGKKVNSTIVFILRGTEFQAKVWRALLSIAKGNTSTYTKIAKQIGRPKAVRAVGTAIGANPICYLIPCHRVLRSDGGLGGYRWGTQIKKYMLEFEQAIISKK